MGVCTAQERPSKKNENNPIKISKDFYLSGIINGSEKNKEPSKEDDQISSINRK